MSTVAARVLSFQPSRRGAGAGARIATMVATARVTDRDWPGDERAVTRFLAGDVGGFEAIVQQYSGMIFSLAARLVGPSEAEDVVQETFLRAFRGLERFRGDSSLKTWLYTIALNRVRARHGSMARLRQFFVAPKPADDDSFFDILDRAQDPGDSPEETALVSERRRRLRAAIRALPEEFRESVVLRDLEGLSYEEIAGVLDVPIGTVRSRIARGRAQLKETLT